MAGATAGNMLQAIFVFFSCCVTAIVLGLFGGSILDVMESRFDLIGFFALPPEWDALGGYSLMVNLFYATPYVLPIVGFIVIISTIFHRRPADVLDEDDEYYYPGSRGGL
jgi:hypothetical protein